VFFVTPKDEDGFSAWAKAAKAQWLTPTVKREVEFDAPGLAGALVGSGDAFGAWNPEHGAPLADGKASLALPVGAVYEYKRVQHDGAKVSWEEGDNRFLWVAPGEGPLKVSLQQHPR
jgi:hypothetical protein